MMEEVQYENGSSRMQPLSKKDRGRKIMDQKANSVADMACVLGEGVLGMKGDGKVLVEVRWKDLGDAELAETWGEGVVHDVLEGGSMESAYGDAVRAADEAKAEKMKPLEAPVEKIEEKVTVS